MYQERTRDILVTVDPYYLEDQSDPDDSRYVWGYRIVIANESNSSIQVLARYWNITDENGIVDEVYGPGVVGKTPSLDPGERYEYTSGCPLDTPSGVMFGHYEMLSGVGERFNVKIPAFSLDSPCIARVLN